MEVSVLVFSESYSMPPHLPSTLPAIPRTISRPSSKATLHRNLAFRTLSTNPLHLKQTQSKTQLPPRPTPLPLSETTHKFLKGSGPGGQKINKSSSAVQLTHPPTGIVIKSQATRSRTQNLEIARRLLAEKLDVRDRGGESRVEKVRDKVRLRKSRARKRAAKKYGKVGTSGEASTGKEEDDGELEEGDEHEGDYERVEAGESEGPSKSVTDEISR